MKTLSNTEAELKNALFLKKVCISSKHTGKFGTQEKIYDEAFW